MDSLPKLTKWILFFLCCFSALAVSAQDDPAFGLINDSNVEVRVGPDFAYPIIDILPRDASVEVIGRSGVYYGYWDGRSWLEVRYGDNTTGWVLGRAVRMGRTFNAIPRTSYNLPRDRNGRVPDVFDLSQHICNFWQGSYSQSGNFMAGDTEMVVSYPTMPGAVNYSVVAIAPSGLQRTFDSPNTSQTIYLGALNFEPGTYTWGVIPYWNDTTDPQRAQQLCMMRIGGTFEKPDTTPPA